MSSSLRRAQPPPPTLGLLSSFPTPPTHIPASPASPAVSTPSGFPAIRTPLTPSSSAENVTRFFPPLCGPPTSPLPPLPEGPSPVTPAEQIAFITMRRTSYASTASRLSSSSQSKPSSRRSSSQSTSENDGSGSGSSSAFPVSPADSAVNLRNAPASASASTETIEEADDRAPTPSPRASTSTLHSTPHARTLSPLPPSRAEDSILLERLVFAEDPTTSDDDRDAHARTVARSDPQVRDYFPPDTPSTPAIPATPEADDAERDGASSPDIAVLIRRTHTPRSSPPTSFSRSHSGSLGPARRSRSSHSSGRKSEPGPMKRLKSTPSLSVGSGSSFYPSTRPDAAPFPPQFAVQRATESALPSEHSHSRSLSDEEEWEDPWDEIWEDGDGVDGDDAVADGSEDDVIDLRTPLPHLMLRAGLLSPHSKLLPRPPPSPEPDVASFTPVMDTTPNPSAGKKKPPRDARDTEKRRQRHKDGRLLRGGIGLTTGLGWSDSEDEDAPSALTNRLSKLAPTLSRKTSLASSVASSAFPRSPSRSTTFSGSTTSVGALSRSASSVHSTPLSRSASNTSAFTHAPEPVAKDREPLQSSALPYLSPPVEHGDEGQELDVPSYPYEFAPPTPTEQGHSTEHGHGEEPHAPVYASPYSSALTPVISPPLHVTGVTQWRPPRSPLFDAADPFACQYQPPAQQHAPPSAYPGERDDRSPTPTNSNTSGTASTTSLPMPTTPRTPRMVVDDDLAPVDDGRPGFSLGYRAQPRAVRKASMPALQQGRREEFEGMMPPPPPRMPRTAAVAQGARPMSKALPPLPADLSRYPSFSASASTSTQQPRTSSIPKTASMSSLRSVASTHSRQAIPTVTGTAERPQTQTQRLRERATSSASMQSLRSMRSTSSNASASTTASSASRARPSLPTPKSTVSAISPPTRARTASTSSTASAASARPLKSAIKPATQVTYRSYGEGTMGATVGRFGASGMAVPRPRFSSNAAALGQTGIAI